jgi:hypothetical protein
VLSSIHWRVGAAALAVGLLFGTAACSSDDSSSETGVADTSGVEDASGVEATVVDGTDPAVGSESDPLDCEADQQAGIDAASMSRSATVLFSADSASGVSDADITAETTMTIQSDGTLSPSTLTVPIGQVFGIVPAEGAGLDAVKIGCADAQTLLPGSAAGFVITTPGTYTISLDIAGTELGTITAE